MSRPIQAGDQVRISLKDWSEIYPINRIEGNYIFLTAPTGESLLYPNENGQWLVYQAENYPYEFEFLGPEISEPTENLARVPAVDIKILAKLNDQDLENFLSIADEYGKSLFELDDFWIERIRHNFGEVALSHRPENLSLKDFYSELSQTPVTFESMYEQARKGKLFLVKWLAQQGIIPDQGTAVAAADGGHLDILEWLEERGILPGEKSALRAKINGQTEVVGWLAERGISPAAQLPTLGVVGGGLALPALGGGGGLVLPAPGAQLPTLGVGGGGGGGLTLPTLGP